MLEVQNLPSREVTTQAFQKSCYICDDLDEYNKIMSKSLRKRPQLTPERQKQLVVNALSSKSALMSELAIAKEIGSKNPSIYSAKDFRTMLHSTLEDGVKIGWLKKVKRSYQLVETPTKEEGEFTVDIPTPDLGSSTQDSDEEEDIDDAESDSPEAVDSEIEYRAELSKRVKRKLEFAK